MYTLRDIVSNHVTFLNETQLVDLEEVNGVSIRIKFEEKKVVIAHVGLHNFLFNSNLKNLIKAKVKKDLGSEFIFKFGI